jgi:hypothetical protein
MYAAEKLMSLARAVGHHEETYQSGAFEKADMYSSSGGLPLWRELMPEKTWRGLCKEHGQDPEQSYFVLEASRVNVPAGIDAAPRETALIAAYLLLEGPEEDTAEQKVELSSIYCTPILPRRTGQTFCTATSARTGVPS